jgi:flagellin
LGRLSSGNRIVSPADDAGGLAVAYKLRSRLTRVERVGENLQNSISFLQVQEGALRVAGSILTRMSELKTMSMDVTKNAGDIENYNKEFVELDRQLAQMSKDKFNGISLFTHPSVQDHALQAISNENGATSEVVSLARNFLSGEYVGASGQILGVRDSTQASQTVNITLDIAGTDSDVLNPVFLQAGNYTIEAVPISAGGLYDAWSNYNGSSPPKPGFPLGWPPDQTWSTQFQVRIGGVFTTQNPIAYPNDLSSVLAMSAPLPINLTADSTIDVLLGDIGAAVDNRGGLTLRISGQTTPPSNSNSNVSLADFQMDDFTNFTQNLATALAQNGAEQQRLNMEIEGLRTNQVNLEAAHGRIMDADIALESTRFARRNVLVQSSAAMVAQANQLTNLALNLLPT